MNIYGIMNIGDDNMNQIELNRKLYNEFEKEKLNESRIIELLKQGANPLGNMSNNKHSEKPYEEILYENKNLDKITGLLLENGMVIDNKDYQNNDMINPLWGLALRTDTIGIKTLKLLLDNKTEVDSIEVFVDHIYTDYILLGDKEKMAKQAVENNEIEVDIYAMKKDLLFINYEDPDGLKKFNKLYNGGNGKGTIKVYRKIGNKKRELIDEIEVNNVGCEYGEFSS